jgi:solute carrier family 25 protein 42
VKGPVAAAIGFTANDVLKLAVPAARKTLIAGAKDAPTPTPATYIESKSATAVESLIAGGTAGAIAKSVIAPADRVKIMYQVDPNRPFSLSAAVKTAKDIVRTEGVLGLWRGNGVMMARVIPYAGVSFLTFPKYEAAVKAALGQRRGRAGDADDVPVGFTSRAVRGARDGNDGGGRGRGDRDRRGREREVRGGGGGAGARRERRRSGRGRGRGGGGDDGDEGAGV